MSGFAGGVPVNGIDADQVAADLEEFNDRIIDLLSDGQRFTAWATIALDDANVANIYAYRPPVAPTFDADDPTVVTDQGWPGGKAPITADALVALRQRAGMVGVLAEILNRKPTNGQSLATTILSLRTRWRRR